MNTFRKVLLMLLLVTLISVGFVYVAGAQALAPSDELYVGIYSFTDLEYWVDHKLGLEAAGKLMGVKTKFVGPPGHDMIAMITAFEQAIAENVAGIIVFGTEESLIPVINKAMDAGILVVTVDADVKGSKRVTFVGTDPFSAGYLGGTKMAEVLGGKGKIAILTDLGNTSLVHRVAGYRAALEEKAPDIEIVQIGDTKGDTINALQVTNAILQRHPDLAGIACVEAAGGAAAATAIEEAGLVGKVKIITMDRDQQVLEKIISGTIEGTLVQKSALMPFYALQIIYGMRHAAIAITSDNEAAGIIAAPNPIDTGVIYVDKSTAEYYMR
ncbi:sugar ABC transporter substrate-binding protein [Candidatus Atribacteria bacterium MT.SAG.1]|nr:sugar ABC transporter substrate-binding protein [Candidatus Atribacteria bacterium MT.SAG.1]